MIPFKFRTFWYLAAFLVSIAHGVVTHWLGEIPLGVMFVAIVYDTRPSQRDWIDQKTRDPDP